MTIKTGYHFQGILFVQLLLVQLIQSASAYMFVGEFHYLDFLSFMKNGSRCDFLPLNISANIKKEQNVSFPGDNCMVFMKEMKNTSAKSQAIKAEVKYIAFGKTYTFDLKQPSCMSASSLQNVEMVLICEGKTVENGIACNSSDVCAGGEICSRYPEMDQQICIPKRHINESCHVNLTCNDKNSACKYSGKTRTCQCIENHKEIDGHCLKVGLFLGEICSRDGQCSGTKFATNCIHNQTKQTQVCSCSKGYIASGPKCIKGGLSLNKPCEDNVQCTGTENANKCTSYEPQTQRTCRCHDGYVEKHSKCYRTKLRLFESCDWSEQCTGSTGVNECKVVQGHRICYCQDGKKIIKGICLKVGLTLDDPCYVGEQCTGTPNSGVCMANNNTEQVCQCNHGYTRYNRSCFQANKTMYEECEIDEQCNISYMGGVCREIGHMKLCLCENGYVEDKNDLICRNAKKAISWLDETENKLLLIAIGGFFGTMMCSLSTIFLALKKGNKIKTWIKCKRSSYVPTETIHYAIARSNHSGKILEAHDRTGHRKDQNESMYDKTNQIEEKETEHFYDFSDSNTYAGEQEFDGSYCHLHKKSLILSADVYGIQKPMFVSSSSRLQEQSSK